MSHVVGCANSNNALILASMAEEIGDSDAIFVPGFTFTAAAEKVLLAGVQPVFVDVDSQILLIDDHNLERKVPAAKDSEKSSPRAIISVELFGLPADHEVIRIFFAHSLILLVDVVQSIGIRYCGCAVGSFAPATACSFYPTKPLGCRGGGGTLMMGDGARADLWCSPCGYGIGGTQYDVVRVSMNSRLDLIQAAALLAKLPDFAAEIEAWEMVTTYYDTHLAAAAARPGHTDGSHSSRA